MSEQRQQAINALTDQIRRIDFARRAGIQYGGDRDLYKVGGYPRALSWTEYWGMYERDAVAGRLIDMVAETTWRRIPEVAEPEAEEPTPFMSDFMAITERTGLWGRIERADKLARVGRYSVILIGTPDGEPTNLRNEMARLRGPDDVLFLQPFAERDADIATWTLNPSDPRYGLPETYRIDLTGGLSEFRGSGNAVGTTLVHHSRLIHVAEGLLRDDVYGRPVLQRCYNDLVDLQKISTSTPEAFWQRVAGILQANINPEVRVSDEQLEALDDELQALYHDLRRTFYGQGVELSRLSETEPDPSAAAKLAMMRIATAEGIPFRVLFGNETGDRASSEDMKSFLGQVAERHTTYGTPLVRALVDRLIYYGGLPTPGRDGYDVVWPSLFPESELDMASANKARAEVAAALTPVGGNPLDLVEIDADRNVWLRPTGERGQVEPEVLDPPEPEPIVPDPLTDETPEESEEEPELDE